MSESKWHVIYTRYRFEKKVYNLLCEKGIEAYLPLYKTLRQWKDRKKWVLEPLFRSYCFVKVNQKNYSEVFKVPGVVKYVWFDGKPSIISEEEIKLISLACNSSYKIRPIQLDDLQVGQKVMITKGIFKNYIGEIVEFKGKYKVLFKITNLPTSMLIQIPKNYLKEY
jgi:transcription antitermination factor NusG